MPTLVHRIAGVVVFTLLAGCVTPYKSPLLDPAESEFPGIYGLLDDAESVDVVSIHGMCTHDKEWVNKTVTRIDTNLPNLSVKDKRVLPVEGIKLYQTTLVDAAGEVRVRNHALVWSALTATGKTSLCYDSGNTTPSCQDPNELNKRKRGSINRAVKSTLMNDCLSDVVLYLGPDGGRIRKAIRAGIDEIAATKSEKSALVLITESLGSKILADSLLDEADGNAERLEFLEPTEQVFMAANQLPLIELSEDSAKRGSGSNWSTLLSKILAERADAANAVQIVAFTDPNDLLSYELRHRGFAAANVIVSNDTTWFWALERPDTAHTGYLDNSKVWELIVCGHSGACKEPD